MGARTTALRAELEQRAQQPAGRQRPRRAGRSRRPRARRPELEETASRLANTIGNYRQRAGRLRDELQGIRRRLDALSPSEIAGYLEELGDDLAELEQVSSAGTPARTRDGRTVVRVAIVGLGSIGQSKCLKAVAARPGLRLVVGRRSGPRRA